MNVFNVIMSYPISHVGRLLAPILAVNLTFVNYTLYGKCKG